MTPSINESASVQHPPVVSEPPPRPTLDPTDLPKVDSINQIDPGVLRQITDDPNFNWNGVLGALDSSSGAPSVGDLLLSGTGDATEDEDSFLYGDVLDLNGSNVTPEEEIDDTVLQTYSTSPVFSSDMAAGQPQYSSVVPGFGDSVNRQHGEQRTNRFAGQSGGIGGNCLHGRNYFAGQQVGKGSNNNSGVVGGRNLHGGAIFAAHQVVREVGRGSFNSRSGVGGNYLHGGDNFVAQQVGRGCNNNSSSKFMANGVNKGGRTLLNRQLGTNNPGSCFLQPGGSGMQGSAHMQDQVAPLGLGGERASSVNASAKNVVNRGGNPAKRGKF